MIERYLNSNTYKWEALAEFTHNGLRWVVVAEYGPEGSDEGLYALYEKDGRIYNQSHELCE